MNTTIFNTISLILTGLSAIATAVMAYFTYSMLKETQLTREEELRPYIVLYLESFEHECWLICENIGKTAAYNITCSFDADLITSYNHNITSSMFSFPIPSMAPGYQIKTFVDSTIEASKFKNKKVSLTYFPLSSKKSYSDSFILNFSILPNIHFVKSSSTQIIEKLETIANALTNR